KMFVREPYDSLVVFFNVPSSPFFYSLSLHDALPICRQRRVERAPARGLEVIHVDGGDGQRQRVAGVMRGTASARGVELSVQHRRSEEHTSELQSREHLVCRLLLAKKK